MTTQRGLTELSSGSSNKKPHLDIKPWLQNLELFEYIEIFCKFKGVEDVIYMSERDLKEIGVKNGAHRAKISSSLILLREKYEIKAASEKAFGSSLTIGTLISASGA
ncbi:ephrin type-A receptor 2-like [Tachypleus tridentatus]|uniref:ephrin type-A receptor 2-like n=1 Tax=Tachypleus tridentatus TaxID=6853 RepID=UPI003FD6333D